ncbi:MAG: peptidoglycan DD-metalloendopeptidase family protein [Eubacterium sp.]|nr:peptidoglycan DD-metalloendopeptidase family protein [Eubacterium sp.]
MRKSKQVITACLVAALFAVPAIPALTPSKTAVVYADEQDEIEEIKEKNEQREREKSQVQEKLSDLNISADEVRDTIYELDCQIGECEDRIADLTEQRNAAQAKVSIIKSELQMAKISKENQYDRMMERIAYSYENGEVGYLNAMMSIDDFSNVLNQTEYVDQVSQYDQRQLTELIDITKEVEEKEAQLKEDLAAIENLKSEAEDEQVELENRQDAKREKLSEYLVLIGDAESEISLYDRLIQEGEDEIDRLEAEYRRKQEEAKEAARRAAEEAERQKKEAEEAARRKEEESKKSSSSDSGSSSSSSSSSGSSSSSSSSSSSKYEEVTPTYNQTGWVWPVPSSHHITSYFGGRSAPTAGATTYHRAIDIGCSTGANIVAIAGGTVMYKSYSSARGYYIRVDHGNGITSLYQHLSGYAGYDAGDHVDAGDVIAYAGNTGISAGTHLHIEIWEDGTPVNPLNYIG